MDGNAARSVEILLVEDNPGDARLMKEALKEGEIPHQLNVVPDGELAIQYLRKVGKYEHATRPDLIVLDLNLPKRDGRQVLEEIKRDEELRVIPVVVLTTSKATSDVNAAYQLQANCYIQKPVDLHRFWDIIRSIEGFWLNRVTLPSKLS
ncbi:MAG TPA: response regulator [Bryobacteraceae bacterium]|nr:response regulator [Bryobacteraceae bacterium]